MAHPSKSQLSVGLTTHTFTLACGSATVTLRISSRARSAEKLPTFHEGDQIVGEVLCAGSCESFAGLSLTVQGKIITGASSQEAFTFLNLPISIWSKASDQGPSKLRGSNAFPFSFALPNAVPVDYESCSLPHTFVERQLRVSCTYQLILRVHKGKLRSDNHLTAPFAYVPMTSPAAASSLRRAAYQNRMTIPGPSEDPAGWETLPGVGYSIGLNHKLSLASPLSYTRGTTIPLSLTISSSTAATPPSPRFIDVRIRRRVRYLTASGRPEVHEEDLSQAVWWHTSQHRRGASSPRMSFDDEDSDDCEGQATLQGEIKIQRDLKPNTAVGRWLNVSYAVVLFTPSTDRSGRLLLEQPVQISTCHAKGPRARAYSPLLSPLEQNTHTPSSPRHGKFPTEERLRFGQESWAGPVEAHSLQLGY